MKNIKQPTHGLKFLLMLSLASTTGAYPALHADDAAGPAPAVPAGSVAAPSQLQDPGYIEGRVYFPAQDRFLENVRVSIDGTDKITFTDDTGSFHFSNVPAGSVKVTANFTGFDPQSRIVTVLAGSISTADIEFSEVPKAASTDDVVTMEKFVVVGSREELGSAIADQEQRHAVNMKTVVSTDEFGNNPTGNIGDFLRNLPGVEVDIDSGGEARWVSLGGAGANYVPVQLGGFDFASAASEGIEGRTVQMQQFSMNNLSRLEVEFAPTPETPGSALGGRVNMVPRGAFESKKAKFNFSTYLIMSDREFTLGRTPGPVYESEKKTKPSWNFSYTNPVSKRFGFTISGGYNYSTVIDAAHTYTWRGISSVFGRTNGETYDALNAENPYSAPYISQYSFSINSTVTERSSAAITADWRLGRVDRLSFGIQYAYMSQVNGGRGRQFTLNSGIDADNTTLEHVEGDGYIRASASSRKKLSTTWMPTLRYMHLGSLWKIDAGVGWSRADLEYTDTTNGYFRSVYADRGNLKIILDKSEGSEIPYNIEAYDATTNAPVDYRSLGESVITLAQTRPAQNYEERRTYFANFRRDLGILGVPVFLKGGVDVRHQIKDQKNQNVNYRYLGPDGIYPANTTYERPNSSTTPDASDNDAAGFAETVLYTQTDKLVGLGDFEYLNNAMVYNLYRAYPSYFQDVNVDSRITSSRHAEELISSGYLRGDLSFFGNKLYLVGGARFEHTHVSGQGPLRVPASNGLSARWIERGTNNKIDYDTWFPSTNAQFKFGAKEQFVFRASWYKSIGRPDFGIYNGSIRLPDIGSDPFNEDNYIQMTGGNVFLKPWTAHTWRGEIAYYFSKRGQLSISAFTRDYTNRHVRSVSPLSDAIREQYGIGPEYANYFVETLENSPYKFTLRELTVSYRQALTILPQWARGFSVNAGATWRTKSGVEADRMTGSQFAPRSFKAGLSLSRKRFTARVDWAYRARYVSSIYENETRLEPGTLQYGLSLTTLNANLEVKITRRISFWAQGDNLLDEYYRASEVVSPSTPGGPKLTEIRSAGVRFTFGIKGSY